MKTAILNTLKESSKSRKDINKLVFKSFKEEFENDKEKFTEKFDKVLNSLVKKDRIALNDDVYMLSSERTKRKLEKEENDQDEDASKAKVQKVTDLWKTGEQHWKDGTLSQEYLRTNPDRITRLFCGNLNRKITEEDLKSYIPGITFIKWITDKSTGEFYGSSFLEMKDPEAAAVAVMLDRSKFMGRPLKIYYCPPRPGDQWPPKEFNKTGGGGNKANNPPRREKTPKPEGSRKLYAGNLSYNIDDDTIVDFFKDCGTIVGLRWLTHQGSGEFRGCGYVEFSTTEEADAAMKLDGKELLGRSVILDWTN